jgi:hypothetical protein
VEKLPSGIRSQLIKPKQNAIIGDMKNRPNKEFWGKIVSFNNNLTPSDIGCKMPKNPTLLGPFLF